MLVSYRGIASNKSKLKNQSSKKTTHSHQTRLSGALRGLQRQTLSCSPSSFRLSSSLTILNQTSISNNMSLQRNRITIRLSITTTPILTTKDLTPNSSVNSLETILSSSLISILSFRLSKGAKNLQIMKKLLKQTLKAL